AIGLRRGASVTARRPLGTTALVALGVLAVALPLLLTLGMPVWSGGARTDADGAVTAIGTVTLAGQVIALMFAIIAGSQIWRAGAVAVGAVVGVGRRGALASGLLLACDLRPPARHSSGAGAGGESARARGDDLPRRRRGGARDATGGGRGLRGLRSPRTAQKS